MLGFFKGVVGLRKFHGVLQDAQKHPEGSPQALEACRAALELFEKTRHQWPSNAKAYQDFYKGLIFMLSAQSELAIASENDKIIAALHKWNQGYEWMKSNNYQNNWIECGVHLADSYFYHSDISPWHFMERAIEITIDCRDALEKNNSDPFNRAIVHTSLAQCYSGRLAGNSDENMKTALAEIRKAKSLITLEQHPEDWIMFLSSEANILRRCTQGDYRQNIAQAHENYEQADMLFSRMGMLDNKVLNAGNWAMFLLESSAGQRHENIEQAVELINFVYERHSIMGNTPDIATTLLNKSSIYAQRVEGKRFDNLETAHGCVRQARDYYLTLDNVFMMKRCETQMALIQLNKHRIHPDAGIDELEPSLIESIYYYKNNGYYDGLIQASNILAELYSVVSLGDSETNAQRSIQLIRDVLADTHALSERDIVLLEQNLANYLLETTSDNDRQEAIELYRKGVSFFENAEDIDRLVSARMNLASIFISATANTNPHDQERAIALLQENLEEELVINDSIKWAKNVLYLGNAYSCRIVGEHEINNEIALNTYLSAIDACSPEQDLVTWAYASINLCMEILKRDVSDSSALLAFAHDHINQVLAKLDTKHHHVLRARAILVKASILIDMYGAFPDAEDPIQFLENACQAIYCKRTRTEWASAKFKLGRAYLQQKKHRKDYLNLLEAAFEDALSIFSPEKYPDRYFHVKVIHASTYADLKNWKTADDLYQEAFAVHAERLKLSTDNLIAKSILGLAGWSSNAAPFCALMQGDVKRALEYNEMLRSRQILDQSRRHIERKTPVDDKEYPYENVRQMVEKSLGHFWGRERSHILDTLHRLYPKEHTADKHISDAAITDIDSLLKQSDHWLVIPFLSNESMQIILQPPKEASEKAILSPIIEKGFNDIIANVLKGKDDKKPLFEAIFNLENTGDVGTLASAIEDVSAFLTDFIGKSLSDIFQKAAVPEGTPVCFVPQWILGLLPLNLTVMDTKSGITLGEKYRLTYTPNISALLATSQKVNDISDSKKIGLISGGNDLAATDLELQWIKHIVKEKEIIGTEHFSTKKSARDSLQQANYWHFATHGKYNWMQPMKSSLLLANGEHLEMHQMVYLMTNSSLRLVVLSTCESGMYDVIDSNNDFNGLATAFLRIGSAGVVSTLWPVSDEASAVFMSYFYWLHIRQNAPPAKALQEAKYWMRNATSSQIIAHFDEIGVDKQNTTIETLESMPKASKPFEHPIFWGAYTMCGV